jgi:putative transposase
MQLRKVMCDRWATDILPLAGEYFRTITKDLMWDKQAVRGHHVGRWLRLGIAIGRIKPGNPQQNGRHERMHLTLKLETTKPAARNFLQQQAKFDDFVDRYNNERPHQALDMQYPAQRYLASSRQYRGLPDIDYPFHDHAITVTTCGRICFNRQKVNLSQVFAGQTVGIKQTDERIWLVSFMNYDLGYFDDETCRLEPLANPFGPKVLPVSSV